MYYNASNDDPDIGRFLSADTIIPASPPLTVWPSDATAQGMWRSAGSGPVNPQDLNRYAYALNNPLKYTDPTGHWVETAWDLANLVLSAAAVWQNPSDPWNWAALAADTASTVLPGVPGGAGAVIRGAKVANVLSDADLLRQVGRAVPSGRAVTSLSQAALATIRTYGIQPYGEFDRPLAPSGTAVHHLVEKRFWQQLGFTSPTEAEQRILAVLSPQTLHGPAGKGKQTITDMIRDQLPYQPSNPPSAQKIWEVHRKVYERLGFNDWAHLVWEVYFKPLGISY